MKLLSWSAADEMSIRLILFSLERIIDTMVRIGLNQCYTDESVRLFLNRLTNFIIKVSHIEITKDNYVLFIKSIITTTKIQIIMLHYFDKSFMTLCADRILRRLPKKVILQILFETIDLAVELG